MHGRRGGHPALAGAHRAGTRGVRGAGEAGGSARGGDAGAHTLLRGPFHAQGGVSGARGEDDGRAPVRQRDRKSVV